MMNNSNGSPVLIVGGGLGGLTTALVLAERGIASRVLEKAPRFEEIGAGLQLAPNATRILRELGVLDSASKQASWPSQLVLADAVGGQRITELGLGESFQRRFGAPYLVMHRGDLMASLLDACRTSGHVELMTDKEVIDLTDDNNTASAACSDGTRYSAEILVGADGLWSQVRGLLVDDQPICAEYVAYRGAIEASEVDHPVDMDSMVMWVGPDLHFVQYPLRGGDLYNQVAVFKSSRYPEDGWGGPDEMEAAFAKVCPELQAALPLIDRSRQWPMYDRDPIDTFVRNRIALLGDAAHPMLQYVAQGACQAIEDAMALGSAIADHQNDLDLGLQVYDAARVARTTRVQWSARQWGEICHIDGIGVDLRNTLLAQRDRDDHAHLEWLYAGGPIEVG